MAVLAAYHHALGDLVFGTRAPWSTSPVTASWCSSTTRADPDAPPRCAMAVRMREGGQRTGRGLAAARLRARVRRDLARVRDLGRIGFEGRYDYGIGTVTNLAARLRAGEPPAILVSQRVMAAPGRGG
jgi:hypothetical protein